MLNLGPGKDVWDKVSRIKWEKVKLYDANYSTQKGLVNMHVAIAHSEQSVQEELGFAINGIRAIQQLYTVDSLHTLEQLLRKQPIHLAIVEIHSAGDVGWVKKIKSEYQNLAVVLYASVEEAKKLSTGELISLVTGWIFPEMDAIWMRKFVEKIVLNCLKEIQELPTQKLVIENGREIYLVNPEEICFIEKLEKQVIYHTADQEYIATATLEELEVTLPPHFYRSHRSYLINLKRIDSVRPNQGRTFKIGFVGTRKEALLSNSRKQQLIQLCQ